MGKYNLDDCVGLLRRLRLGDFSLQQHLTFVLDQVATTQTQLTTLTRERDAAVERLGEALRGLDRIAKISKKYVVFKPRIGSDELWKTLGIIFEEAENTIICSAPTPPSDICIRCGKRKATRCTPEGICEECWQEEGFGEMVMVRREDLENLEIWARERGYFTMADRLLAALKRRSP